jgi:maltooligosyltrehalose trehalohydrolase
MEFSAENIGATFLGNGKVHFRLWAPRRKKVEVLFEESALNPVELERKSGGYFEQTVENIFPGMLYRYRLDSGSSFPDPASRFQPSGPHGPSMVVDSQTFKWTDENWRGVPTDSQVIYEIHVGTFTRGGTWVDATEKLSQLKALGATVIEVMPVADFPGKFGWGYDGVNLFAPCHLYGSPDAFRSFVNHAHELGIGVILDVVYNHFGPDGNYLAEYSDSYFTDRYENEWGRAINFDDPDAAPVRNFIIQNVRYWISEYHLDGFRFDATQQIFDSSEKNIILESVHAAREAAAPREIILVAENEPQDTRLVRSATQGGYGMNALWNDDFHHSAIVALTGRNEAYYMDYRGSAQELLSAVKWGYLYQGQRYKWQQKRRGTSALDLDPQAFVNFLENHDQVANSPYGHRLAALTSPGKLRAMTALLLLSPGTPMLFQGQEYAPENSFLYFADFHPELNAAVYEGRKNFLSQFRSLATDGIQAVIDDPSDPATFERSKLPDLRGETPLWLLHRDLLAERRNIGPQRRSTFDGAILGEQTFLLRFFGKNGVDYLLIINLDKAMQFDPAPEPLLAPVMGTSWKLALSTEAPEYGGYGSPSVESEGIWRIPAEAAVLMKSEREKL